MDFICFSHLRWNFVFQRPQHLFTRFSKYNRVFFIEEPILKDNTVDDFLMKQDNNHPNIFIVIPSVNKEYDLEERHSALKKIVDSVIKSENINTHISWYYSPMALPYSKHLKPEIIIYDCMDELSAFKNAPQELKILEYELLKKADLVFTGGDSIYNAKKKFHNHIHCFPSSIDNNHFAKARTEADDPTDQKFITHPRLGFFGVIDERLDIRLIDQIATLRPDLQIILLGPVVKIDPSILPQKENIHYLGFKDYNELPSYLSGWDIAILPFAKNEATQFISPTKTPEYLAGGKPVISTSINDVVNPYGINGLVHIADSANDFIKAVDLILKDEDQLKRFEKFDKFLNGNSWDSTWKNMNNLIEDTLKSKIQSVKTKTHLHV